MQVRAANRLRFEEFDLDVGCRTLSRAGRRLDLRPRSFDVLVYLAEAAGRPVGKDEILEDAAAARVSLRGSGGWHVRG